MEKSSLSLSLEVIGGPIRVRGLYVDDALGVLHPHAVLDKVSNTVIVILYAISTRRERASLPCFF